MADARPEISRSELVPIFGLKERWGVNKSTLYRRMERIGIVPIKIGLRAFITPLELERLDRLNKHLVEDGGSLESFEQPIVLRSSAIEPLREAEEYADILQLIEAISRHFAGARSVDPVANQKALIWLAENGVAVPTSKVKELIGSKPVGQVYVWGSFQFEKCGKLGRSVGWLVKK
jgi:hypothetical protein